MLFIHTLTSRFHLEDVYAEFDVSGQTLALYHCGLMAEAVGAAAKPASADAQDATMLVLAAADLDAAAESLRLRGVVFVAAPQDRPDRGIRTAHLRDPNGNLIEINNAAPT